MKIEITPVVIVPDMSPLIHLAAVGRLPLLQAFGRVVVVDIVAFEASGDPSEAWAREVAAWLTSEPSGEEYSVEVAATEIGEAYRLARQVDPNFRPHNAGDRAIRDWLVETLPELAGPALVVYEDKRLPGLRAPTEITASFFRPWCLSRRTADRSGYFRGNPDPPRAFRRYRGSGDDARPVCIRASAWISRFCGGFAGSYRIGRRKGRREREGVGQAVLYSAHLRTRTMFILAQLE